MNTDLKKAAKNCFEKDFFKLMNNSAFGKSMKNVQKHRDIMFVTTEKKKLFGARTKLSYYKAFHRNLLTIEMKKTQILINKPVYYEL